MNTSSPSESMDSPSAPDNSVSDNAVPATPAQESPPAPLLASHSKSKSMFGSIGNMFTPVKEPSVTTQELPPEETEEQKSQRLAKEEAARIAAEKTEKERFEKKFKPAQRKRILARQNAFKKRNKETADKEAADDTIDHPDKLTKSTKGIIYLVGPVIAALYILAWAFPAFSAIIAALVIGAAASTVSYFAYKLYIKVSHTAKRINKITVNFEEDYLPEILEQVEEGLDSFIETTKATTETAVQFSKDLHAIRENTDTAKDALAQVITKFDTLSDDATKKIDKLSTDASTTLGDVSKNFNEGISTFKEAVLHVEVLGEKLTLGLRHSILLKNYEQNIVGVEPLSDLREDRTYYKSGRLSKKTICIAKKSTTELLCRFLDDKNILCNIVIPMKQTEGSREILAIATEDRDIILNEINLYIVRKTTEENKASLIASRPAIAAAQGPALVALPLATPPAPPVQLAASASNPRTTPRLA